MNNLQNFESFLQGSKIDYGKCCSCETKPAVVVKAANFLQVNFDENGNFISWDTFIPS